MTEVMPGDLAIVIKSKRPEEVGRVVKIINIISDGEKFFDDRGSMYTYSTKYGHGFLCSGRVRIDQYHNFGVSPFPAHCLMSISRFDEGEREVS